jgi:eukaryotic-like serine/threonine-protein kinase
LLRERGTLAEDEALHLAADVAAALEVAHGHGIVHRDVKPRNVLVDANGTALLADFGIAAPTDARAEPEAVYATALYVSPEQAQGRPVDGRGDLYSLGAMLYELLTGRPPFRGDTPEGIARQHVHAAVVAPRRLRPGVSKETERVVLRALEKDPSRRFANAGEMRRALQAAAGGPKQRAPRSWNAPRLSDLLAPLSWNLAAPRLSDLAAPRLWRWAAPRRWKWAIAAPPLVLLLLVGVPKLATARQASVPPLAGQTVDAAKQAAAKAGLTLELQELPTEDTPAGVIVSQDPGADAHAPPGATVHALVSSGVTVPDLTGQQCASARAAEAAAGWSVKPVRWRIANISAFGRIVAQDPAPGSVVPSKGQIAVQVAGPVAPC